jgi:hypothetical protein
LTELEIKYLMSALANMPDIQPVFSSVHEQGIKIVSDMLGYNQGIDIGNGESSFGELLQLLETSKSECLGPFEQDAFELWNRYKSFGIELAELKRRFEEAQSIYPVDGQV